MKKNLLILAVALLLLGILPAYGQDDPPPRNDFVAESGDADTPNRRNILRRELQLSDQQMVMIRRINLETRPKMAEAQTRLKLLRQELDAAIYADDLNEDQLRERVRSVIEAEAEVTRIRAMSEVAVRKVLTPEQLVRFRELRQRFARQTEERRQNLERRENMRRRMQNRDQPPPPRDQRL